MIILTTFKLHTHFYACTSLLANIVKKKCVIINAENFKQDMALWDIVFPFGQWRAFNSWDIVFPFGYKGSNLSCTKMWSLFKVTLYYLIHNKLLKGIYCYLAVFYLVSAPCGMSSNFFSHHITVTIKMTVKATTKTDMVVFWEIMVGTTIFRQMQMCKFIYTFVQVVLQIITYIDANLDFFSYFLLIHC